MFIVRSINVVFIYFKVIVTSTHETELLPRAIQELTLLETYIVPSLLHVTRRIPKALDIIHRPLNVNVALESVSVIYNCLYSLFVIVTIISIFSPTIYQCHTVMSTRKTDCSF